MKKSSIQFIAVCCMLAISTSTQAQSWKDIFNKENVTNAVNAITGNTGADFTGTWNYTGSAIDFKSDNLLQKAGGAVAAAQIKAKLDEQLLKVGVKPGMVDFTFNADSTFTGVMDNKKMEGTYSYDAENQRAYFTFARFITLNAQVSYTSSAMSLLFDADKLLLLLTYLGQQSDNPTISTLGALAGSYDGMRAGLQLKKK